MNFLKNKKNIGIIITIIVFLIIFFIALYKFNKQKEYFQNEVGLYNDIKKILNYNDDIYAGITMNNEKTVQGWMSNEYPKRIRQILEKAPANKELLIIEVGTWEGKSAIAAADIIRDLGRQDVIICIDTWLGSPEHFNNLSRKNGFPNKLYETFIQNVVNNNHQSRIIPIPLPSAQASELLKKHFENKADIIYIDAAHEFLPVLNDINEYWPLLKNGGFMLGDDYQNDWPGVIQAVNKFVKDNGHLKLSTNDVVWEIQKPI